MFEYVRHVNLIADNKILTLSKFKALSDDKLNVTPNIKFFLGRVGNVAWKGEKFGYQYFLLISIVAANLNSEGTNASAEGAKLR